MRKKFILVQRKFEIHAFSMIFLEIPCIYTTYPECDIDKYLYYLDLNLDYSLHNFKKISLLLCTHSLLINSEINSPYLVGLRTELL